MTRLALRSVIVGGLMVFGVCAAHAAQAYVSASVGGVIAPGVYGRVDIGNAAPPPVIYSTPMMVAPPAMAFERSPIYLYVPPGHAQDWRRYCHRYSACNQPVYFVNVDRRGHYVHPGERHDDGPPGWARGHREYREHEHEHEREHGRGHGGREH